MKHSLNKRYSFAVSALIFVYFATAAFSHAFHQHPISIPQNFDDISYETGEEISDHRVIDASLKMESITFSAFSSTCLACIFQQLNHSTEDQKPSVIQGNTIIEHVSAVDVIFLDNSELSSIYGRAPPA